MKKLFAIVAMMGLFATTQVYALDDNEPVAGEEVQDVQGDEALESEESVEQEEAEEPVDKNVLVDKLADTEKNKKEMDKSLADFKKAFDDSKKAYEKLQKDSTACCNNIAKFEGEKTKLAEDDAKLTEALYKMKIERIVKNVEVIFDSKKDNKAFKTALKKDNENIAKKEKDLNTNKKNLDAKIKAIADEKAKYEALLPNVKNALFVKDSLDYEVQVCDLKGKLLDLEIENLKLNIALGEENADNAAIEEKLGVNEGEIEEINAKIEEVTAAFTALKNEKYPPVVEDKKEDKKDEDPVEVTEGGIKAVHKGLKTKFIEGGPEFMALVSIALVIGLAFCIERIIYLSFAKVNAKALMGAIAEALSRGDVEAAKAVCRKTSGPVASICYQGLLRIDEGLDVVERSVVSYGSLQSSMLEKGCSWITLFIAMAPSLGFLGTVIGMVMAFDTIQREGDISPTIVAGGMKVALITTIYGIIVALILQVFYNFILTKIESIVADMEDSSITLLDLLTKYNLKK